MVLHVERVKKIQFRGTVDKIFLVGVSILNFA